MKTLFAWQALHPSAQPSQGERTSRLALLGVFGLLIGASLQVGLGQAEGNAAYIPLIASLFLFGLPHGAIDHLVALGLAKRRLERGPLSVVIAAYLCITILYALVWWLFPVVAAVIFLGITIYHWGAADTAFDLIYRQSEALRRQAMLRCSHTLLRGTIPILVPFLAFPEITQSFLDECTALFGVAFFDVTSFQLPILIGLCALILFESIVLLRYASLAKLGILLLETALLLGFFAWVQPLVAIGWYFCLWHGWRHMLRLLHYSEPTLDQPEISLSRFLLFARRALPFTLLPICFLLGSTGFLLSTDDLSSWIALYLVVIASLTLPHLVVVRWMDHRELPSK